MTVKCLTVKKRHPVSKLLARDKMHSLINKIYWLPFCNFGNKPKMFKVTDSVDHLLGAPLGVEFVLLLTGFGRSRHYLFLSCPHHLQCDGLWISFAWCPSCNVSKGVKPGLSNATGTVLSIVVSKVGKIEWLRQ